LKLKEREYYGEGEERGERREWDRNRRGRESGAAKRGQEKVKVSGESEGSRRIEWWAVGRSRSRDP
jgi:hypothetical protein